MRRFDPLTAQTDSRYEPADARDVIPVVVAVHPQ
ncbi:MAG: hypothetical protein QOG75_2025, partial [Mycobacterium sp.]|nr:hypothetical protein [Mycobacterium sp.]